MAEIKTKVNDADVHDFINTIDNPQKKQDALTLLDIFTSLTGEVPKMWGSSMIGFGQYHYKSERSSQEGDWMMTGFSPRKQAISLYVLNGSADESKLLEKLGKHKKGVGCLYVNKLADIDLTVLKQLISSNYAHMKSTVAK